MSFYITTPIYYVNAEPHLGHAYSTIGADVIARHMRQRGEETFFLTGTDEHGEPVSLAADRLKTTPQELADKNAQRFLEMTGRINASNDFFIRTTDPRHVAAVEKVVQLIFDNGYVYEGLYEGLYCPRCADFKSEREVEDGDRCPIHHIELDRESEDCYFFKLSAFQERLEKHYADQPDFVLPRHRYNEALSFIAGGLQDVALSRANLTWGVPVPWNKEHVIYVWIDALLNYWSALGFARATDQHDRFWPPTLHVMAKDILKFHAVIWPALLMAANLELPQRMFVHGYLLMDGEKMSKSLGNVLDPNKVIDLYGADALRFYCCREVVFGQDGSVSTEGFEARYTSELANDYGNLASRTLAMVRRYRDGVVPPKPAQTGLEVDFANFTANLTERFDAVEITAGLEQIWVLVRRLNRFVEEQAPWNLAKDDSGAGELDLTLYALVEGLRCVSVALHPFMPEATNRLLGAMGRSADAPSLACAEFGLGPGGQTVGELEPLFPKLEPAANGAKA